MKTSNCNDIAEAGFAGARLLYGVFAHSPVYHIYAGKDETDTRRAVCGEMLMLRNLTANQPTFRRLCKNCDKPHNAKLMDAASEPPHSTGVTD